MTSVWAVHNGQVLGLKNMHCEAQKVIFKYELCFSVQVDRNPSHCFSEAQKIISVRVPPVICFSETRLTLWVSG